MATTVRTKPRQKQPAFDVSETQEDYAHRLERAVCALEDAVFHVLDLNRGTAFHDVDFLFWSRQLKNIAMQASMALSEYRGQPRFHEHYRHDPEDYDRLNPVAGPAPLVTLARVCREALTHCSELSGVTDETTDHARTRLETALRLFLGRYQFRNDVKH